MSTFRSRRVMALLAYAIVEARPLPRSELAELLWPDRTEKQGRANLRWALNQVTGLLPDCWEINRQSVRFQAGDACQVDVLTLDAALARENGHDALAAAVGQVQGDFLAGFFFDESPDFETWLVTVRERWRQRVDQALVSLIDRENQAGRYAEALRFARQRLDLDPWVEDSHRTVMRLLAQIGQIETALDQYETCRRILLDELGVEPTAATVALAERLRRAATGPRHNLPPQPTAFVGREAELEAAAQWLADPDCRLLCLIGTGGMGKTRLALATAEAQAFNFLDGVTFLSLAGVNPAGPDEARILLVNALVNALGLATSRQQVPREHLLTHLSNQERLLVLDNFELLLNGVDVLVEILERAPGVKMLVTSQERLNVRWERLLTVEGLSYPMSPADPSWRQSSAVQLFCQAARRADPGFVVAASDREPIVRICRLVEGMPLGLELAASWVRVQSCAAIADEIQHSFDVLKAHQRDRPARQQSMRSVFDHSWQLLTATEQTTFSRLAVFQGPFTFAAARAVAGATWDELSALVDKSLLRRQAGNATGGSDEGSYGTGPDQLVYELHALLRQYAAERLQSDPAQAHAAQLRHCRHYATLLADNSIHLRGGQQQAATMAMMAFEMANIRAAWDWAVAQPSPDLINQLLPGVALYLDLRNPADGAQLMRRAAQALSGARSGDQTLDLMQTRCSLQHARFALAAGEDRAWVEQQLQACLSIFEQHRAGHEMAKALHYLGNASYPDQLDRVRGYWRRSLALYRQAGDQWAMARILMNLGVTARTFVQARRYYRRSHVLCRQLGDQVLEGHLMFHLANVEEQLGNYVAAEELAARSVEHLRAVGDPHNLFIGLINLVVALQGQGKLDQARSRLREARAITESSGTPWNRMAILLYWGRFAQAEGDYDQAERLLLASLAKAEPTKYGEHIQQCMNSLGLLCLERGHHTEAQGWFERSLQVHDQQDRKSGSRRLEALVCLGQIALLSGTKEEALSRFRAAHHQAATIGAEVVWIRAMRQLAQAHPDSDLREIVAKAGSDGT